MKTIESYKGSEEFNFLKNKILDSGSDNLDYFGGKFQGKVHILHFSPFFT